MNNAVSKGFEEQEEKVDRKNKLAAMSIDEQRIYRNIFLAVTETASSLSKAKETIETIMKFNQGGEAESP